MALAKALYVISVDEVMLSAPPKRADRQFFEAHLVPNLRPMSDADYMQGPAVILQTLAPYSYILYQGDVYWCAEWEPGLVVVRFSPGGGLAWTVLRSPIPDFGGREASDEELEAYDEDAENHQYNLVYQSWDARFDQFWRTERAFRPASAKTAAAYRAALAHADALGERMRARYSDEGKFSRWQERCRRNLRKWAGDGILVS